MSVICIINVIGLYFARSQEWAQANLTGSRLSGSEPALAGAAKPLSGSWATRSLNTQFLIAFADGEDLTE